MATYIWKDGSAFCISSQSRQLKGLFGDGLRLMSSTIHNSKISLLVYCSEWNYLSYTTSGLQFWVELSFTDLYTRYYLSVFAEKTELETPQEPADIVWSSSESDWSDRETKRVPSRPRAGRRSGIHKQTILNSYSRYLDMLNTVTADHGGSDGELIIVVPLPLWHR